jgi:ATP-dependent DNA helicase RecG
MSLSAMNDAELEALFLDLESDRVERKEALTHPERVKQAIAAFANDLSNSGLPGVVFVGQRDDLSCAGLLIDDDLLLRLAGFRSEGTLLPFPSMDVRKVTLRGCTVAAVIVRPTDNPPIKFDGRIWVRVGPRRAMATPDEERRLLEKRRWGNLPFDSQPVVGATLSELDLQRVRNELLPSAVSPEALAENHRPEEQQLQALRLLTPGGFVTATALLLCGTEPRRFFPGAYVQFLRIAGRHLTDPIISQKELGGTLPDQLRQLDELIAIHVTRRVDVGGPLRREVPDYPEEALRQLVRNAVMHRTYEGTHAPTRVTWFDDRIEIQNPGGPYGMVTKANFGQPQVADYRNPTIASWLKHLGLVERFGVGIAIARHRLAANGNPPPVFQPEDAHTLVTLMRRV